MFSLIRAEMRAKVLNASTVSVRELVKANGVLEGRLQELQKRLQELQKNEATLLQKNEATLLAYCKLETENVFIKKDLMENKGLLNCRGVLEEMLRRTSQEASVKEKSFNARRTYESLDAVGLDKDRGPNTKLLLSTAKMVFEQFSDSSLTILSERKPGKMYGLLYKKLSGQIHEPLSVGSTVRIMYFFVLIINVYF